MTIFETQPKIKELESICSELLAMKRTVMLSEHKKNKRKLILKYFLLFIPLFAIPTTLITLWFVNLHYDAITLSRIMDNIFVGFQPGFSLVVLGYFVHFIRFDKKATKAIDGNRALTQREEKTFNRQFGERSDALNNRRQELMLQLNSSEVPSCYRFSFAIDWMIQALVNKRADTLKEAINLYENYVTSERHHAEQMQAINNIKVIENYYY